MHQPAHGGSGRHPQPPQTSLFSAHLRDGPQALEFAIERGLQRVEAGAQGEHKLQRGYVPSLTHSLHYLPDPGFAGVVDRYLQQERAEMEYTLRMLRCEASPYKQA